MAAQPLGGPGPKRLSPIGSGWRRRLRPARSDQGSEPVVAHASKASWIGRSRRSASISK
jgi:hypothetical protein